MIFRRSGTGSIYSDLQCIQCNIYAVPCEARGEYMGFSLTPNGFYCPQSLNLSQLKSRLLILCKSLDTPWEITDIFVFWCRGIVRVILIAYSLYNEFWNKPSCIMCFSHHLPHNPKAEYKQLARRCSLIEYCFFFSLQVL